MLLVDRLKLGLIRARAEFIRDCSLDNHSKTVAQAIIDEIKSVEEEDKEAWDAAFGRCD
jgi:hypothetical protein